MIKNLRTKLNLSLYSTIVLSPQIVRFKYKQYSVFDPHSNFQHCVANFLFFVDHHHHRHHQVVRRKTGRCYGWTRWWIGSQEPVLSSDTWEADIPWFSLSFLNGYSLFYLLPVDGYSLFSLLSVGFSSRVLSKCCKSM